MKENLRVILSPISYIFIRLKIHPNFITIFGFLLSLIPPVFIANGNFIMGGILIILTNIFDAVDGDVARKTNNVSKFGALLDSTLDRFSEFAIFLAFIYYFKDEILLFVLFILLMFGSFMVSYVRARAEGLGYSTKKGPMDRTLRIVFIVLMCFFENYIIYISLFMLIMVYITVFRRLYDFVKNS